MILSAVSFPAMNSQSLAKNPFFAPRSSGVMSVVMCLTRGLSGGSGQTQASSFGTAGLPAGAA